MKQLFKTLALITLALMLGACDDNSNDLVGKWDDTIKLSEKKVEFNSDKNSKTITTQGDKWWVGDISIEGENLHLTPEQGTHKEDFKFSKDYLTVERDKKSITITMDENKTNAKREVVIILQAGDYFDYIHVTQDHK
ncbi:BACON domain-containing carbohydrate-binding protein [Porphyromonadaceae bacterium W3.11]|nr:BACON domain-containing carbohydrate-binding protein [Porphyromonadaceae bacterium W3.11]